MKPADPARMRDEGVSPAPSSCRPPPHASSRFAFGLRPQLHACAIESTLIFLDIEADRYFAMTGEDAEAFQALYELEGETAPYGDLRRAESRFVNLDLLREMHSATPGCRPCVRPPPIGSAYGDVLKARIRPLPLLRALLTSLILTRLHSFSQMIQAARRWKDQIPGGPNHLYEAIDHARSLHRITPFLFTRHESCLFRSLLLVRYLHVFGIPADWEFGVRLAPFCAHCWVEHEGIVLNDHQDTVLSYTKILSV
jgi:hypothetical protein